MVPWARGSPPSGNQACCPPGVRRPEEKQGGGSCGWAGLARGLWAKASVWAQTKASMLHGALLATRPPVTHSPHPAGGQARLDGAQERSLPRLRGVSSVPHDTPGEAPHQPCLSAVKDWAGPLVGMTPRPQWAGAPFSTGPRPSHTAPWQRPAPTLGLWTQTRGHSPRVLPPQAGPCCRRRWMWWENCGSLARKQTAGGETPRAGSAPLADSCAAWGPALPAAPQLGLTLSTPMLKTKEERRTGGEGRPRGPPHGGSCARLRAAGAGEGCGGGYTNRGRFQAPPPAGPGR